MKPQTKKVSLHGDAIDVFARLAARQPYCFLLETLEDADQPQTSSQSYIGIAPQRIFTTQHGQLYIDGKHHDVPNPYLALRDFVPADRSLPAGYIGGLVGYFAHEGVSYLEPTLQFDYARQFPDFQFGEYRDGLVFAPDKTPEYFYYDQARSAQYMTGQEPTKSSLEITFNGAQKSEAEHAAMIEKARADITDGRVFQVVLANKYDYRYSGDLLQLYRQLRRVNPSPFMFFMKFGNVITMGASPELLAHTKPGGEVYLEALAGTIRRGSTADEDQQLSQKLLADQKEIAEHAMLVDLARNDVGRIAKIGSVQIENLMYVKRLSHVQHICSIVKGRLAEGRDMFDSLAASFPAGTLSGAPKIEAIKMIAELEREERGPYGGTIGYFSYNGDSMHAVNIRSVSAIDDRLFLHSGSGIVYDSRPGREYQEINEKKAAMMRAMEPFLKGEAS